MAMGFAWLQMLSVMGLSTVQTGLMNLVAVQHVSIKVLMHITLNVQHNLLLDTFLLRVTNPCIKILKSIGNYSVVYWNFLS